MQRKGKRFPQAATPESLAHPTEAARDAEPSAADDARLPESSMQDNPASDATIYKAAASAEGEQRGRKRSWNAEAEEPGKTVAISQRVMAVYPQDFTHPSRKSRKNWRSQRVMAVNPTGFPSPHLPPEKKQKRNSFRTTKIHYFLFLDPPSLKTQKIDRCR